MQISFACPSCGKSFKTDAGFAGKKARCKDCGHVFHIPEPKPQVAPARPRRPASPEPTPPRHAFDDDYGAGFDPYALDEPSPKPKPERSPYEIDEDLPPPRPSSPAKRRARRRRSDDGFAWFDVVPSKVYLAAFAFLLLAGCLAAVAPGVGGPLLLGGSVLIIGSLYLYGALGFLILPFRESVLHGLGCIFIPFYSLYYLITRWDVMRGPFLNTLGAAGLAIVLGLLLPAVAAVGGPRPPLAGNGPFVVEDEDDHGEDDAPDTAPAPVPFGPGERPGMPRFGPGGPPEMPRFGPGGQPEMPRFGPGGQPEMPRFGPGGQPEMPRFGPGGQPGMPRFGPGGQPGMPRFGPGERPGMPRFGPGGPGAPPFPPQGASPVTPTGDVNAAAPARPMPPMFGLGGLLADLRSDSRDRNEASLVFNAPWGAEGGPRSR